MLNKREQILETLHKEMNSRIVLEAKDYVDAIAVPDLCRILIYCIGHQEYQGDTMSAVPFTLVFTMTDGTGEEILVHDKFGQFITDHVTASSNVFELDYNGRLKGQIKNEYIGTPPQASAFSTKTKGLVFIVVGRQITLLMDGKVIDYIPNASLHYRGYGFTGKEMHINEWKKILLKYEQELKAQKRLDYWASPKTNGVLMNKPEKLFQKDLVKFIEMLTHGCKVDREALSGDDRSDIKVTTFHEEDVYYFELKCVGTSHPKTELDDKHANGGLHQINVYVTGDEKAVMGALITFNARKDKKAVAWLKELTSKLDSKISMPPVEIHLDNESASSAGKRLVREATKKAK